jgi:hypothetical protein
VKEETKEQKPENEKKSKYGPGPMLEPGVRCLAVGV